MRVGAEKVGGVNQDFLKVGWGGGVWPGRPPPPVPAPLAQHGDTFTKAFTFQVTRI